MSIPITMKTRPTYRISHSQSPATLQSLAGELKEVSTLRKFQRTWRQVTKLVTSMTYSS
ncbi:hypothetical protein KC19_VG132600 [Ceratodon purpureus]|uniref:Uncharacterized protein n=1 Tax=Ceratodon purpureus TaxID=3225 RepID=A0A8T0HQ18_CERPU|nr:hypothetical protein KC19_VG132600 [Ceratodon purpureus]